MGNQKQEIEGQPKQWPKDKDHGNYKRTFLITCNNDLK